MTGLDDCEFASITGTFDGWTGWGTALCDEGLGVSCDGITTATIAGLEDGSTHEYLVICASGDGWWNDIWANQILQPELGSACDFLADEYANYGFTVSGSDMTLSYCAGTCDATCESGCIAGDVNADDTVDVLDVVSIVADILDGTMGNPCADMNGDGFIGAPEEDEIEVEVSSVVYDNPNAFQMLADTGFVEINRFDHYPLEGIHLALFDPQKKEKLIKKFLLFERRE